MEKSHYEHFFRNHKKIFVDIVFRWFPVNLEDIEKCHNKFNSKVWQILSHNPNLVFNRIFLNRFGNNLDWTIISQIEGNGWTPEFIHEFNEKLLWGYLSLNPSINWDINELVKLEKFSNYHIVERFALNPSFPWSIQTIQKIGRPSYLIWDNLSKNFGLFWTEELLALFSNNWNWSMLSDNPSLPWSDHLIELYLKKWDWFYLSRNPSIPWTEEMITKYFDYIIWPQASENTTFPWSIKLVETYLSKSKIRLSWNNISIKWTPNLVENLPVNIFEKKEILRNSSYKAKSLWTEELIQEYCDNPENRSGYYPLGCFYGISKYENLNWSLELLKRFEQHWYWEEICSNKSIPWNGDILEYVLKQSGFHSHAIGLNSAIPWSIELIELFEYYWTWENLITSKVVWEKAFKNNISDAFVSNYLMILDINLYDSWKYVYEFGNKPNRFKLKTKITFGKYLGESIEKIYTTDPSYLEFCLLKFDDFLIDENELTKLQSLNMDYTISTDAIIKLKNKTIYFNRLAMEEAYNQDLYETTKYDKNSYDGDWWEIE
jgi:hypothetical protein